jgi:ornithine decarboxylase
MKCSSIFQSIEYFIDTVQIENLEKVFSINNVKIYDSEKTIYDIIECSLVETENIKNETPFYIVDIGELIHSFIEWKRLLPTIEIYYAMKCNPNPVLLEVLSILGSKFDCASESEMKTILEVTNDPSRILFANPCKMPSHIRYASKNHIRQMTFDNEEELYKIAKNYSTSQLLLRIAVDDSKSICKFSKKFGAHTKDIEKLLVLAKSLDLKIVGFSFHVGSGCSSGEQYYQAIRDCWNAYMIAKDLGIEITIIDIGGGFQGVDKTVPFEEIAKWVNTGITDFFTNEVENHIIRFIAEPGRFFAEKTQTLVVNVMGKKTETDNNKNAQTNIYYLNDGMYGSFNCIYFDHSQPLVLPYNKLYNKLYNSRLFGPTCDSMDMMYDNILLPELSVGDWLFVPMFGAYTDTASSTFNGFKTDSYRYIYRDR